MSTNSRRYYEFGPFRVDESERLLLRGEDVVPLTPKAFEMLLVLVQSSGHVFTKEELMKRVWPDSFVEEANLSHNVYKLREALGDGRNGERYIETMPRRGYRFVAKVTGVSNHGVDLVSRNILPLVFLLKRITRRRRQSRLGRSQSRQLARCNRA